MNHEHVGRVLAAVNATLNGTAAMLLLSGRIAIARGRRDVHAWCMGSAFIVSAVFLVSYLTRVYISRVHHYPGSSGWRTIYFALLTSHMILAVATPPLAIRAIQLGRANRLAEHRQIVRWTWPVWMYVSVTGVLVYMMLYHPPG